MSEYFLPLAFIVGYMLGRSNSSKNELVESADANGIPEKKLKTYGFAEWIPFMGFIVAAIRGSYTGFLPFWVLYQFIFSVAVILAIMCLIY